jgi:hypothetical protein
MIISAQAVSEPSNTSSSLRKLDADGIAYADPGTLDLAGFNLDRFPTPWKLTCGTQAFNL